MPFVTSPPADAVQCNGPLLYAPNRYVDPNGIVYSAQTEGRYKILKSTIRGTVSWGVGLQLLEDGTTIEMNAINAFYVKNKGENKVHIRGLLAYYFVEKIDPSGMRTEFINIERNPQLHASNIRWVDASSQRRVCGQKKSQTKSASVFLNADEIDFKQYTEWNGYWVKNDGTEVLKKENLHVVPMRMGSDGYLNINLTLSDSEKHTNFRINRLMAIILRY